MPQTEIRYLKYPEVRDVVFILGAGASRADKLPLQENILPLILSERVVRTAESEIGRDVVDFVKENFHCDPPQGIYPKIEAVFGFIDYFHPTERKPQRPVRPGPIREIKEHLIKLIHYIVNLETDKGSKYYHLFWKPSSNTTATLPLSP